MKILFIGDIVGRPGRELTRRAIPVLTDYYHLDLVVANVENAAGGAGITREVGDTILGYGAHVMTSGNHVWDKREATEYIVHEPRLLRPANYPAGVPGSGRYVTRTSGGMRVGVINVMGRVFMLQIDNPFAVVIEEIEAVRASSNIIIVDFHAEATSEKLAMGWHLDGKVTAVVGTHTHVQTADDRVLPGGTAYITDVGMTGPHDSVIGVAKEAVLSRFLTGMPVKFETATGDVRFNGVVITASPRSGRATAIERLSLAVTDIEALSGKPVAAP